MSSQATSNANGGVPALLSPNPVVFNGPGNEAR